MLFYSRDALPPSDCTDETIRKGLSLGSSPERNTAIKCLYAKCLPEVKKMVLRNSGTAVDAEDLFQDTLCVLLNNVDRLDKKVTGSPQAYVRTIAKHRWFNALRARKGLGGRWEEFKDEGTPEHLPGLDQVLERETFFEAQEACIAQMTAQCQAILSSIYSDDRQRMDDLANDVKLANAATARQTKYRCLQRLKACMLKKLKTH